MSHRASVPPSPSLPPSLYSGMSSLQISQAGPGTATGTESSFHLHTSQPQKALLKGPKTARHQSRKSEYPSSSVPWKDPRQAVAASAGHRRTIKDDASYKNTQLIWSPFPPDTRPTTRKERDIMLRAVTDHAIERNAMADMIYSEHERKLSAIAAESRETEELVADSWQTLSLCFQGLDRLEHHAREQGAQAQRKK